MGFVLLIKGADLLVDGASSLAKRYRISDLVIGLTIVAFGTSSPELILNLIASWQGAADLAIGNVIGSNISNILLITGIAAVIYPIKVQKNTINKEVPFSLLAIILLAVLANDFIFEPGEISHLGRIDGILLILFFGIFMYYSFGLAKRRDHEDVDFEILPFSKSLGYILIGIVGLTIGGHWIIQAATTLAHQFGLSDAFIGLTLLAIGTSLPELATAIVAAVKKKTDLAIGNIVGSNIFNIFLILGISSVIKPLMFNPALNTDIVICILTTAVLFYFALTGKKTRHIDRWEGGIMLFGYVLYLGFLIWRG